MTLMRELEVAKELARRAGDAVRSFYSKKLTVAQSNVAHDIVTITDLIADDIIVLGLQQAFPHDALCSEQTPFSSGRFECDRLWLIDALDGSADFSGHGDEYAVSIGLAVRGQAVLGVVYNPARDELFAGAEEQPTTINGSPVNTSVVDQFAGARIGTPRSEYGYLNRPEELHSARAVESTSYQLARVAAGMDDGFFSVLPEREWTTCAGVALVFAAGGCATLQGALQIGYNSNNLTHPLGIIAAGCHLHGLLNKGFSGISNPRTRPIM